jgi:hypothetical protein
MRRKTPCFSNGDIRRGFDFELVLHGIIFLLSALGFSKRIVLK